MAGCACKGIFFDGRLQRLSKRSNPVIQEFFSTNSSAFLLYFYRDGNGVINKEISLPNRIIRMVDLRHKKTNIFRLLFSL